MWVRRKRPDGPTWTPPAKKTDPDRYQPKESYGRRWKKQVSKQHVSGFRNITTKATWPGLVMPQKVAKKFEYEEDWSVDTGALNTSVTKTFRTNDLYDPDFTTTVGGDSVQNYSTFINASLYQSWRVYGAKITLTAMNLGGSMAMIVPLLVNYDALVATTGASEATVNNYTAMPSSAEPIYLGPITSGTNVVKKSFYCSPWVALGLSRLQYSTDPLTAGTYGNRTGKSTYVQFVVIGVGGQQAIVKMRVSIVYYANLFELVDGVNRTNPGTDPNPIPV